MKASSSLLAFLVAYMASSADICGAADEYEPCTEQQVENVYYMMQNEIAECKKDSTYELLSETLPSSSQRKALCECEPLVEKVKQVYFPRCLFTLSRRNYPFTEAMESVLVDCRIGSLKEEIPPPTTAPSGDGSSTDGTPSPSPTAQPSPSPTPSPSVETSSSGSTTVNSTSGSDDMGSGSEANIPTPSTTLEEPSTPSAGTTTPARDDAGRAPVTDPNNYSANLAVSAVLPVVTLAASFTLWN